MSPPKTILLSTCLLSSFAISTLGQVFARPVAIIAQPIAVARPIAIMTPPILLESENNIEYDEEGLYGEENIEAYENSPSHIIIGYNPGGPMIPSGNDTEDHPLNYNPGGPLIPVEVETESVENSPSTINLGFNPGGPMIPAEVETETVENSPSHVNVGFNPGGPMIPAETETETEDCEEEDKPLHYNPGGPLIPVETETEDCEEEAKPIYINPGGPAILYCSERNTTCPVEDTPVCTVDCTFGNCPRSKFSVCDACSNPEVLTYRYGACNTPDEQFTCPVIIGVSRFACLNNYEPVCVYPANCTDISCAYTAQNSCKACAPRGLNYYTKGACEKASDSSDC